MDIRLCCVEAGEGFPLVLLHGNGEDHTYFKRQMGPFSQHFRVIAVDTRGHGESPRGTAPFTLEQFAEDLKEFLDGRSITRCHLLGFSDGGNIALLFALKYPEYVEKLILNGADLCPSGVKLTTQLPIVLGWGMCRVPALFSRKARANWEMLDLMVTQPHIPTEALARLPMPALVVAGERDMIREGHTRASPPPSRTAGWPSCPGTTSWLGGTGRPSIPSCWISCWTAHRPRRNWKGKTEMDDWFTLERIDEDTDILSEYRHWEETHCYLLRGRERSLLIDTGLGICEIRQAVDRLTDRPVAAVATHIHWDHIGGHRYFPEFYAHEAELNWLSGGFPLSVEAVRAMVADRCCLPEDFDVSRYTLFQGHPARVLRDGDRIELGGRTLEVRHTPGHSPGHMCFWEAERGYLFSGDLVYRGTLFACYPSTDPEEYLSSLERTACLPMERLLPAHHALDIGPELLGRVRDAFRGLKEQGKLRHGGGTFDYGDWAVRL